MRILNNKRARISAFVGLVILALTLPAINLASRPNNPQPTPRPTDLGADKLVHHDFPSLSYGIHAFLWWNATNRSRDLERIRLMRFGYVKQIVDWNDLQAGPNEHYNWINMDLVVGETEYRGLKLIARFGKPPYWVIRPKDSPADEPPFDRKAFGEMCGAVATRYKGKVAGYQVWNEPNLDREWDQRPPNPAAYVKFLAECFKAIKAADPSAVVISAPLAPTGSNDLTAMPDEEYLHAMFDAGLANYYDVLGLNAPGYKSPPEIAPDDPAFNGNRWQAFRHVEDMRAIQVARDGGAKQVALLEVGWTRDQRDEIMQGGKLVDNPYRWHAVTEQEQADYLVRAYQYAALHWRRWVGLIITIYMPEPNWTVDNEETWWSIAEPGNSYVLYKAYFELANMPRYMDDVSLPAKLAGINDYQPLPPWIPTTPTPTSSP